MSEKQTIYIPWHPERGYFINCCSGSRNSALSRLERYSPETKDFKIIKLELPDEPLEPDCYANDIAIGLGLIDINKDIHAEPAKGWSPIKFLKWEGNSPTCEAGEQEK